MLYKLAAVLMLTLATLACGGGVSRSELNDAALWSQARVAADTKITLDEHTELITKKLENHAEVVNGRLETYYTRVIESVDESMEEYYTKVDTSLVETVEEYDSLLTLYREQRDAALTEYGEEVRRVTSRGVEETNYALREALSAITMNTDVRDALCTSDYWLSTLWATVEALLVHLEGGDVTIEDLRGYGRGISDYGDEPTDICRMTPDGTWEVK